MQIDYVTLCFHVVLRCVSVGILAQPLAKSTVSQVTLLSRLPMAMKAMQAAMKASKKAAAPAPKAMKAMKDIWIVSHNML